MKQDVFANVALAVGATLAVAIAIGFALGRENPATPVARATAPEPTIVAIAATAVPPMARPAPAARKPAAATPAPARPVRTAALPPAATRAPDPFEPPVASIPAAPAPRRAAATPPPNPPVEQVASLTDAGLRPPPVDPSIEAPPPVQPSRARAGDPLPGLRTVAFDSGPVAAHRDRPPARIDMAATPAPAPAPPQDRQPVHRAAFEPPAAEGGPHISGPAVVTSALELNINGQSLRLYGLKLPRVGDMCAPDPAFAARDCTDASRQALAAYLGDSDFVSCRILAVGGGGRMALPAVCANRDGHDIGTYLVTHGFALADPNEIPDYSPAEATARAERAGLWFYR